MIKYIPHIVCLAALMAVWTSPVSADDEALTFPMPESCKSKNMNFCFDDSNYPRDIVEKLLSDMKNFEVAEDDDVGQIGYRQGESSDEYDCRSQSTTDPIHYIVDESGRDRVVIQLPGKFEQRYSVLWCDKEGRVTSRTQHFLASTVKNNKITCENKYMNYDFMVLSLKPEVDGYWKMERASTNIPVCCACRLQQED